MRLRQGSVYEDKVDPARTNPAHSLPETSKNLHLRPNTNCTHHHRYQDCKSEIERSIHIQAKSWCALSRAVLWRLLSGAIPPQPDQWKSVLLQQVRVGGEGGVAGTRECRGKGRGG